jgi:hypothetical protein
MCLKKAISLQYILFRCFCFCFSLQTQMHIKIWKMKKNQAPLRDLCLKKSRRTALATLDLAPREHFYITKCDETSEQSAESEIICSSQRRTHHDAKSQRLWPMPPNRLGFIAIIAATMRITTHQTRQVPLFLSARILYLSGWTSVHAAIIQKGSSAASL